MPKKITQKEFIERARLIHADKYDYSRSIYNGMHKHIDIICKKHGVFKQTPQSHIRHKAECIKCSYELGARRAKNITKKKNKYQTITINNKDKTASISLKSGHVCIIDLDKLEAIKPHYWQYDGKYAFSNISGIGRIRMHRFILGLKKEDKDKVVDHINLSGLDNRMSNLRICNQHENAMNRPPNSGSSIYKGVSYVKRLGKFKAEIGYKRKTHYLGLFYSEKEAAMAYDEAAKKYFGRFAYLNFKQNEKSK